MPPLQKSLSTCGRILKKNWCFFQNGPSYGSIQINWEPIHDVRTALMNTLAFDISYTTNGFITSCGFIHEAHSVHGCGFMH